MKKIGLLLLAVAANAGLLLLIYGAAVVIHFHFWSVQNTEHSTRIVEYIDELIVRLSGPPK